MEKKRIYDIIIPVYGALPYLRQCVNSVVDNTEHPYNLVIIDDGNDAIIVEYLRTLESIRLITNERNLGWAKSCNIGIENTENDVILLNSDTMVTRGWLEKMDRCAYSSSRIGMVNPLTNAPDFLSITSALEFNVIQAGFTLESFSNVVSELAEARYPEIPIAFGFCLLIKRELLKEIGLFDEELDSNFGGEYHFYMKAKRKGYKAVLCDDAFVYHYGRKGFCDFRYREVDYKKGFGIHGDSPQADYYRCINRFNKNTPLSHLRKKLLKKISEVSSKYRDKVSIIMPVYNREKYLEEAVSSVLSQSYSNFELIAVDDGSTDNSINILGEFASEDKRILIVNLKERRGVATARNEGLKRARGEFITQFDSDDVMLPGAIKSRVEFLNSNPDIDLVFGRIDHCIDEDGKTITSKYSEYVQYIENFYGMKKDSDFYEKIKNCELEIPNVNSTSMFRRRLLFQTGYYEDSLTVGEDKEFFFRILERSTPAYLAEPIILYRMHADNLSGKVYIGKAEWGHRPENAAQLLYLDALLGGHKAESGILRGTRRRTNFLNGERKENSMKIAKKPNLAKNSNQRLDEEDRYLKNRDSHVELLMGQIAHMAEQIDDLRSKVKDQHLAIITKDQHINNLNEAIAGKDQHIANLERFVREKLMNLTNEVIRIRKYSVFYNLLSKIRRELLKFFGKVPR